MKSRVYDKIVSVINKNKGDDCTQHLLQAFPKVDAAQLNSIYGQEQQKRVKKSYHHYCQPSTMARIYKKYTTAVERGEGPGIILNLARHHNFSPAMMAKFILEQFLSQNPQDDPTIDTTAERLPSPSFIPDSSLAGTDTEREQHKQQIRPQDGHLVDSLLDKTDSRSGDRGATYSSGKTKMSPVTEMCEKEVVATSYLVTGPRENSLGDTSDTANKEPTTPTPVMGHKSRVNKLYRETSLIPDKVLSFEVHLCLLQDDVYGPFADTIKHAIGHEYEVLLCRKLEQMDIGYQTEDDLRVQGCDKTPDIKLDVPIGVDGRVVNWIESKASFGDRDNHKTYLKDQFWSYWNRFGPGLVIYWFGFIDELNTLGDQGILLTDHFPTDIVKLDPLASLDSSSWQNDEHTP